MSTSDLTNEQLFFNEKSKNVYIHWHEVLNKYNRMPSFEIKQSTFTENGQCHDCKILADILRKFIVSCLDCLFKQFSRFSSGSQICCVHYGIMNRKTAHQILQSTTSDTHSKHKLKELADIMSSLEHYFPALFEMKECPFSANPAHVITQHSDVPQKLRWCSDACLFCTRAHAYKAYIVETLLMAKPYLPFFLNNGSPQFDALSGLYRNISKYITANTTKIYYSTLNDQNMEHSKSVATSSMLLAFHVFGLVKLSPNVADNMWAAVMVSNLSYVLSHLNRSEFLFSIFE